MEIEAFEWDENNETKIARRIDPAEMLENPHTIIRNKNRRAGTYRLIGRSLGGRVITVVLVPTGQPEIWRPVSAWLSDSEEQAHAKRAGI